VVKKLHIRYNIFIKQYIVINQSKLFSTFFGFNKISVMKKIILLASLCFCSLGYSQITLSRHSGEIINDGQVVAYNTIAFPAAEMDFYTRNLSTTTATNVKVICESLVNSDGTGFELCYGNECLSFVEEGERYPSVAVNLPPNGVNGDFDHFLNTNATGVYPQDYTFRFYQIGAGGAEIGNSITMTYRFDPNLSVDDINQLQTAGVIVKSTLVENQLVLDVLKNSAMQIFDLNGKVVLQSNLNYGIQSIDVSNLSSGVYVANFISEQGNSATKKFIKK
jgi:hypothetical protein